MITTQRLGWRLAMAGLLATAGLLVACGTASSAPPGASDQLAFGIAMAQRGLWSEAHFRFEQAARGNPRDARILNNLAVANEALGNFDAALESYRAALALAPGDSDLKSNYDRFVSFYESFRARQEAERVPPAVAAEAGPEADSAPAGGQAPEATTGPVVPPGTDELGEQSPAAEDQRANEDQQTTEAEGLDTGAGLAVEEGIVSEAVELPPEEEPEAEDAGTEEASIEDSDDDPNRAQGELDDEE